MSGCSPAEPGWDRENPLCTSLPSVVYQKPQWTQRRTEENQEQSGTRQTLTFRNLHRLWSARSYLLVWRSPPNPDGEPIQEQQ